MIGNNKILKLHFSLQIMLIDSRKNLVEYFKKNIFRRIEGIELTTLLAD